MMSRMCPPSTCRSMSTWIPSGRRAFTGKRLLCDADTVGQLDFIRVKNVCLQANLVEKRNAPGEYSLYADVMYVEQDADADPYAERYARYAAPEAVMAEPDEPNDTPF